MRAASLFAEFLGVQGTGWLDVCTPLNLRKIESIELRIQHRNVPSPLPDPCEPYPLHFPQDKAKTAQHAHKTARNFYCVKDLGMAGTKALVHGLRITPRSQRSPTKQSLKLFRRRFRTLWNVGYTTLHSQRQTIPYRIPAQAITSTYCMQDNIQNIRWGPRWSVRYYRLAAGFVVALCPAIRVDHQGASRYW